MRLTVLRSLSLLAALVALSNVGCAGAPSIPTSVLNNPLIGSLTSGLGVSPEQAVGGTGAMMGLAQSKLTPSQFEAVGNAIPGLGEITKAAGPILGNVPLSSLGDVQNVFSKLGMSPDMVTKFAPVIGDAVAKGAGAAGGGLTSMLGGLFK
jgi:hypothetical protein